MDKKEHTMFTKARKLEPHALMQFKVIHGTALFFGWVGVLLLLYRGYSANV